MEKRWGVFFQPSRSKVRGTGQRPWGEPATQIDRVEVFRYFWNTCFIKSEYMSTLAVIFCTCFCSSEKLPFERFSHTWLLICIGFQLILRFFGRLCLQPCCHSLSLDFQLLSNFGLKIFTTTLAKVLSLDFQIVLKVRLIIFSNLISVSGSVTEKVASHFAAFLDLKVGHLDLNNYCKHIFHKWWTDIKPSTGHLKGSSNKKNYQLNLIFWKVSGCNMALFCRSGLKTN